MQTVIIGVDPSSKKIAATITVDDGEPVVRVYQLPPARPVEACLVAYVRMRSLCKEFSGPDFEVYVFIEDPIYVPRRGGAKALIPQARTNGSMLAGASSVTGVHVQGVDNRRAKKQVVGNGNASKDMIKQWCLKCWPAVYHLADGDQDIMDSAMINRHGQKIVRFNKVLVGIKKDRKRILGKR